MVEPQLGLARDKCSGGERGSYLVFAAIVRMPNRVLNFRLTRPRVTPLAWREEIIRRNRLIVVARRGH